MGYDGSGGYDRAKNFSSDASAGIKILASGVDTEFNDFASAMTLPVLRDGQNEPTADLPMGGNKHANVGAAASATDYMRAREFISNVPIYFRERNAAAGVTKSSISAAPYFTTASANHAPAGGTKIYILRDDRNSSEGAWPLYLGTQAGVHSANVIDEHGKHIAPGHIKASAVHELVYNSAHQGWQLMNPHNSQIAVNCTMKASDAVGTLAGSNTVLVNFTQNGDLTQVQTQTLVSVSCSISANRVWLSGTPSNLHPTALYTPDQIQIMVEGAKETVGVYMKTSGSVVYMAAGLDSFNVVVTVSADVNIVIPEHTVNLIGQRG